MLDATDVRIFCEMGLKYTDYNMFSRRHISPTAIGRKLRLTQGLRLDEKTIRLRVKKMEDEGFIKYYQAIPNVALFGLKSLAYYRFEAADVASKYEALQRFQGEAPAIEIGDWVGSHFMALLAGPSAEETEETAHMLGERLKLEVSPTPGGSRSAMEMLLSPNKLDWQMLARLRYDALCSPRGVAKELSITPRMAEYRISKLLNSRVFFVKAMINPQKQQGIIFYGLVLLVDETKQDALIRDFRNRYHDKIWLVLSESGMMMLGLFASSIGEPDADLLSTLQVPGVYGGFVAIFKEWFEPDRPNWIDRLVEARIGDKLGAEYPLAPVEAVSRISKHG